MVVQKTHNTYYYIDRYYAPWKVILFLFWPVTQSAIRDVMMWFRKRMNSFWLIHNCNVCELMCRKIQNSIQLLYLQLDLYWKNELKWSDNNILLKNIGRKATTIVDIKQTYFLILLCRWKWYNYIELQTNYMLQPVWLRTIDIQKVNT